MIPAGSSLRFIPRRSPPFLAALAISLAAMAVAICIRGLLAGWSTAFALSVTHFPAFVVATLFAGSRWGWASLFGALVGSLAARGGLPPEATTRAGVLLYALSGAVTVMVASTLREIVLRLDEAQAALDRSETRLQMAQKAGEVGLWDWDVATGQGRWSPTLYRILGLAPDTDASIRALLRSVHPDDREWVRQSNVAAIRSGKMAPIEYRILRPDGEVRWVLSRGEMLQNGAGKVVRAVGVNIDITERRHAFEKVRESDARFRALADSAPVLLWVSKTDGRREFVNQAYVDYLGASYEEALSFDWRERLHREDLSRILQEQIAGEASRKLFTLEARYMRADGAWRWIRSVSQPRYGPGGEFVGFIGIGVDVTDAKQAERDLMRINDLLAERVQAALAERDEAQARLHHAQKLEAVGQLTGGVAHDFNNLLTVIIGALDLIQRRPADEDRRERMIEAALGAARRGERLTHQLLAFSRRQALKPEPLRIDDLLAESEPLLRRAAGEAAAMVLAPGAPGAVAMLDQGQFDAAVMNLVVNARDATPAGGEIRIETAVCDLADGEVPDVAPGPYVRVTVRDNGVGMDAEVLARVFEPFFTTKDIGKGTGLGLSQVYGFARQSGGGVAIDAAPHAGASVSIYLPCTASLAADAEPPPAPADAPVRALDILLVEDDPAVGDMIAAMLSELGHRVARADGVDRALTLLGRRKRIDLMLTDLVMPGGRSGLDLARAATTARPGLPVVLSSGFTGEALAAVADAPWPLLRKPYSAEALARAIASALDPEIQAA
ncbi:PAS domain-containing protein [Phenylobacterium sp.]|jgi:PAS domain S-box-containing protein|uniref:hybrid sensor histidine kinase/response regulator n=1 Tax=Phenylobacterium sp. TaxID=1871053 RepID=UPI0035B13B33